MRPTIKHGMVVCLLIVLVLLAWRNSMKHPNKYDAMPIESARITITQKCAEFKETAECTDNFQQPSGENSAKAFWEGDISSQEKKRMLEYRESAKIKYELVVSHCDTSLDWLWDSPLDHVSKITIYTKCKKPVSDRPVPSIATVVKLRNVGRCDHTFAYHMARLGEEEPNNIIIFMKDSTYRGAYKTEYLNAIRTLDDMGMIAMRNGFGCGEKPATQHVDDVPVGNALSFYHQFQMWKRFQMLLYNRDPVRDQLDSFISPYCSLGEFYDALPLPPRWVPPAYVPVCYGGVFAVQKERIHQYSKQFWASIELILSRGDNIQEGHYMERSWALILSKQLSSGEEARLELMTKCAKSDDAYSLLRSGILETVWDTQSKGPKRHL